MTDPSRSLIPPQPEIVWVVTSASAEALPPTTLRPEA
jgi:hypothetical protein